MKRKLLHKIRLTNFLSILMAPISVLAGSVSGQKEIDVSAPSPSQETIVRNQIVQDRQVANILSASAWGSSSAERVGSQFFSMFREFDERVSYYNGGKGGETSSQTAARLGSIPLIAKVVGGVIPEVGAVKLNGLNVKPSIAWKAYHATVSGVPGEISVSKAGIQFTRSVPGATVEVSKLVPVLPIEGPKHQADLIVLWMGKNDIAFGYQVAEIANVIDKTFDWLAPCDKRCLILGVFNDSDYELNGIEQYKVESLNTLLAKKYGRLFVDIQSHLVSGDIWGVVGIAPTLVDIESQRNRQKPPSLSRDNEHLNEAGYRVVRLLVQERIKDLGWYE